MKTPDNNVSNKTACTYITFIYRYISKCLSVSPQQLKSGHISQQITSKLNINISPTQKYEQYAANIVFLIIKELLRGSTKFEVSVFIAYTENFQAA